MLPGFYCARPEFDMLFALYLKPLWRVPSPHNVAFGVPAVREPPPPIALRHQPLSPILPPMPLLFVELRLGVLLASPIVGHYPVSNFLCSASNYL